MEILFKSLSTISSIAVIFLAIYFKNLPKLLNDLTLENKKNKNQSNLQREAYFREISGENIQNIFNEWMSLLADSENYMKKINNDKSHFIELQSQTMMYGSDKTVKILAEMMQFLYGNNQDHSTTSSGSEIQIASSDVIDLETAKTIYFMAKLITSLKEDFTGYSIEPMNLIEIRLNDINLPQNIETWKLAKKYVDSKIN